MRWNWYNLLRAMNYLLFAREGRCVWEFPWNRFGPLYFPLFSPMKGFVSQALMWS